MRPYEIEVEGHRYRTDDLTLDEAIIIEADTGRPWIQLNPLASASDCKAVYAAFLARSVDRDVAIGKVGAMTLEEIANSIKLVERDLPTIYEDGVPKAEGGGSTDGSSPAPDGSDGPHT